MTENLEIALATDFLATAGDGRDDLITVEKRPSIKPAADLLPSRKAQSLGTHHLRQGSHARVVEIEEGKVALGLVFKNSAFCGEVFIDGVVSILMIDGHIQKGRHPGMKVLDRFQLETGHLDGQVLVRLRLSLLSRL